MLRDAVGEVTEGKDNKEGTTETQQSYKGSILGHERPQQVFRQTQQQLQQPHIRQSPVIDQPVVSASTSGSFGTMPLESRAQYVHPHWRKPPPPHPYPYPYYGHSPQYPPSPYGAYGAAHPSRRPYPYQPMQPNPHMMMAMAMTTPPVPSYPYFPSNANANANAQSTGREGPPIFHPSPHRHPPVTSSAATTAHSTSSRSFKKRRLNVPITTMDPSQQLQQQEQQQQQSAKLSFETIHPRSEYGFAFGTPGMSSVPTNNEPQIRSPPVQDTPSSSRSYADEISPIPVNVQDLQHHSDYQSQNNEDTAGISNSVDMIEPLPMIAKGSSDLSPPSAKSEQQSSEQKQMQSKTLINLHDKHEATTEEDEVSPIPSRSHTSLPFQPSDANAIEWLHASNLFESDEEEKE